MTEQTLSDRVLARKKREAQALKANIQRRKEQARQQADGKSANDQKDLTDE